MSSSPNSSSLFKTFLNLTLVGSSFITGLILGTHSPEERKQKISTALEQATQIMLNPFQSILSAVASQNESGKVFYVSSGNSFKGGRYYPVSDFIDNIEEFLSRSNPINKFVIGFLGFAALTGGTFLISDLLDTFGRMANQAQVGAAEHMMGNGLFPLQMLQMAYHQNIMNRRHGGGGGAGQQQQQNNNDVAGGGTGGGPRQNQEFVDRMEYVGARQPPDTYRPHVISENQASTTPCCVVCLANTVVESCGHLVLCWPCAMAMANHEEERGNRYYVECPVCRQRAIGFSYVMMS